MIIKSSVDTSGLLYNIGKKKEKQIISSTYIQNSPSVPILSDMKDCPLELISCTAAFFTASTGPQYFGLSVQCVLNSKTVNKKTNYKIILTWIKFISISVFIIS